jgi:hypothetical protein
MMNWFINAWHTYSLNPIASDGWLAMVFCLSIAGWITLYFAYKDMNKDK